MGYTTHFEGEVQVAPPLAAGVLREWRAFNQENHFDEAGSPGSWCQWEPTADGSAIRWDGGEKFYDAAEWMRAVVEKFVAPAGSVANGTVLAQGEEADDRWAVVVEDSAVYKAKAKIVVSYDDQVPVLSPAEVSRLALAREADGRRARAAELRRCAAELDLEADAMTAGA